MNILNEDFTPILNIVATVSYLIGLCLIIAGIARLHKHGSGMQQMMNRSSPMATAMYFVVGVIMISYMPYLQMLSNSIFGNGVETALFDKCGHLLGGTFQTDTTSFCPMMAYTSNLQNPTTATVG